MFSVKKSFFFVSVISFTSCNINSTPKCGDNKVIEISNAILGEKIKDKIVEDNFKANWYSSNEYKDAEAFTLENGYNLDEYLIPIKEKYRDSLTIEANMIIKRLTLKNIRTVSIDEKIKQCDCSADVESRGLLKPINVEFSAQETEDKGNPLYVELIFNIKE